MALNRRNPIWPYLLVLACLFGLAIAAPRGWQRSTGENHSDALAELPAVPLSKPAATAEIVRPTAVVDLSPLHGEAAVSRQSSFPETKPQFEDPAEKIAENHRFDAGAELRGSADSSTSPDSAVLPAERSTTELPARDPDSAASVGVDPSPFAPPAPQARRPDASVPVGEATLAPTLAPQQTPNVVPYSADQQPPPPAAPKEPVERAIPSKPSPAAALPPEPDKLAPAPSAASTDAPAPLTNSAWPPPRALLSRLKGLEQTATCRGWCERVQTEFAKLNQLGPRECKEAKEILDNLRALVSDGESLIGELRDRAAMAEVRRVQYAIVRRLDLWDQVCTIRRRTASSSAAEGTDGLLAAIESYELNGLPSDGRRLAEIRHELVASPEPDEQELARRLNIHYRNANLRVAISAALVNRLMPEQQPTNDDVNEMILGSPVYGRSTSTAKLSVRLVPDPRRWQFDLVAAGNVDSQTRTTHGPVTFINSGAATFQVRKHISIDAVGMKIDGARAEVANSSELAGLYTSFDSMPIVRSLVRSYAISQEQQKQGQAEAEAKTKIAAKAMRQVDTQAGPKLTEAQDKVARDFIDPLRKLALDPTALAMETTDSRLVMRSRLAGCDQLGANTGRPEAPSDSFASAQIHESTLNNVLEHLDLAGRTFTLPELHAWLAEKLNRAGAKPPDDLPAGVHVTFAKKDPVHVRCESGRMELILNIAEIRDVRRRWHDFEVRAAYRPAATGLAAQFERDGTIELGGAYKGKPEVALRGIFSKVLSRQRPLNLFSDKLAGDQRLAGLEVTQLVVEDGWIATAIGPVRTASRHETSNK